MWPLPRPDAESHTASYKWSTRKGISPACLAERPCVLTDQMLFFECDTCVKKTRDHVMPVRRVLDAEHPARGFPQRPILSAPNSASNKITPTPNGPKE
jgi:hypothetical protein